MCCGYHQTSAKIPTNWYQSPWFITGVFYTLVRSESHKEKCFDGRFGGNIAGPNLVPEDGGAYLHRGEQTLLLSAAMRRAGRGLVESSWLDCRQIS